MASKIVEGWRKGYKIYRPRYAISLFLVRKNYLRAYGLARKVTIGKGDIRSVESIGMTARNTKSVILNTLVACLFLGPFGLLIGAGHIKARQHMVIVEWTSGEVSTMELTQADYMFLRQIAKRRGDGN